MSTNASVTAAQRRRAGGTGASAKNNNLTSNNVKLDGKTNSDGMPNRTLGLTDVLGIQSRQLKFLKEYQEGNERHWEANDEFLHQLSEKVDELSDVQANDTETNGANNAVTTMMDKFAMLEKEVAQLHGIVASLQDELLQKE